MVNKARSFQAADEWDIQQQIRMSPAERRAVARQLKRHAYGRDFKDVRECHREK